MISAESAEVLQRSEEIYRNRLKEILEPTHRGEFVAIEPDSGDYYLGKKMIDVMLACQAAHPDRLSHIMRVGFPAAVEIGYAHP